MVRGSLEGLDSGKELGFPSTPLRLSDGTGFDSLFNFLVLT